MSVSSGVTLISPSATALSSRSAHSSTHPNTHRKASGQGHANHTTSHHGAHSKRRASGHATHSQSNGNRRGSEGDRRAIAAGLAMHVLEQAADQAKANSRRKSSHDRPLPKSSRSDTHLPRLSRTTSATSNTSDKPARPKRKPRKHSGESVLVVDENGKQSAQKVNSEDSAEEDWEESGDDDEQVQVDIKGKGKGKTRTVDNLSSQAMRRTASDTQALPPSRARSITTSPLALQPQQLSATPPNNPHRQRTMGFAGSHAAGDPLANAQRHIHDMTPHYNDSMHVMPAHQIKHQKSFPSLQSAGLGDHKGPPSASSSKQSKGDIAHGAGSHEGEVPASYFPPVEAGDKSYAAAVQEDSISPRTQEPPNPSIHQDEPSSQSSKTRHSAPPGQPYIDPSKRHQRLVSETAASSSSSGLRVRPKASNSSLRSQRSLRAPPHPLNSPTGYRTGLPSSRQGSEFNSPSKVDHHIPSMHHPPIAPPVVYREFATGHGWDIPEDEPISNSSTVPENPINSNGHRGSGGSAPMIHQRQVSSSSARSLQSLLRPQASPSSSTSSHPHSKLNPQNRSTSSQSGQNASRRRTALEVTSAASKFQTTNDPVLYHHSLGHLSASAETAHLISRFLPQKKLTRPRWEITAENLKSHSGVGLSRGDYRDAHESLIRSMREMGITKVNNQRTSRSISYQSLLGSHRAHTPTITENDSVISGNESGPGMGVGMVQGRNGPLVVAKGGWRGKTPIELSVERCLAQRPRGLGVL